MFKATVATMLSPWHRIAVPMFPQEWFVTPRALPIDSAILAEQKNAPIDSGEREQRGVSPTGNEDASHGNKSHEQAQYDPLKAVQLPPWVVGPNYSQDIHIDFYCWCLENRSRSRFSSSTLTRGSPRTPNCRPCVCFTMRVRSAAWSICRA